MDKYNEFAERDAARAQADKDEELLSSQYVQALGLLSTIKGDMLINVNDPIGMAKEIEAYVSALRQRAEATEATLTLLHQALDAGVHVHLMPSGPDYAIEIVADDKGIGPYVQGFAVESTFTAALKSALEQLARYTRR